MRIASRFLSICIIALVLGTQWAAHQHRIEHRSGLSGTALEQVNARGATAEQWGHEALSAECALYDALTCGAAHHGDSIAPFASVALPTLFLLFLSAHVALRSLRATARGPPRLI